jgi:hypothetical protein
MKNVSKRIANLPTIGDPRLEIEVLVFAYERVEEQLVDALGKGVCADARIEVSGTRLDNYRDGLSIGMRAGAADQREEQTRRYERMPPQRSLSPGKRDRNCVSTQVHRVYQVHVVHFAALHG